MARSAVLAGRTLADLIRSAFILQLQLGVGILLGFRWQTGIPALLAALGRRARLRLRLLLDHGHIGLAVRNTEAIQAAVYMVVFPFTLISSVFLPTQTMPGWLQAFAEHQPITIVANALRGLTLGQGALPAGHTVAGRDPARPRLDRRDPRRLRRPGGARLPPHQQLTAGALVLNGRAARRREVRGF